MRLNANAVHEAVELIGFTKLAQAVQQAYDNDRISETRARRIFGIMRAVLFRQRHSTNITLVQIYRLTLK